jgi:hypothetical protein
MKNDLVNYTIVKEQMQTGDLLLWSCNSIIGWAIKKYTKSNFSHASLVIRFDEYDGHARYNLEAGRHGTVLNVLSKTLEEYDGQVWWYPLKDDWNLKRKAIGDMSLSLVGTPYDFGSVLKFLLGSVSINTRRLFCSEYCYICYGFDGKAPAPGDILKLGIFKEGIKII